MSTTGAALSVPRNSDRASAEGWGQAGKRANGTQTFPFVSGARVILVGGERALSKLEDRRVRTEGGWGNWEDALRRDPREQSTWGARLWPMLCAFSLHHRQFL